MVEDGWTVEMIDIEAAFLEAELDEDIYIEWPEGVEEFGYFSCAEMDGQCLKLERAMRAIAIDVLQDLCETFEVDGFDAKLG